jgi:hypothetical protein
MKDANMRAIRLKEDRRVCRFARTGRGSPAVPSGRASHLDGANLAGVIAGRSVDNVF